MTPRIRSLIVDDEALSRRGLEIRLRSADDFELVGQCANGRDALAAIRALQPELVFLDIQMPGLSGFDVIAQLPTESLPMVVFVTAYDHYAVRAFEARAIDYLLKPVDEVRFAEALEHVRELRGGREAIAQQGQLLSLLAEVSGNSQLDAQSLLESLRNALPAQPYAQILPIRDGRETLRLATASINWIDAAGDYMCIHAGDRTHILRGTMKELEQLLDPRVFQRVHRSTIVNLARVSSLRAHMNGEYFLTLDGGHELKLSRSYRDKVEHFLKGPRLN